MGNEDTGEVPWVRMAERVNAEGEPAWLVAEVLRDAPDDATIDSLFHLAMARGRGFYRPEDVRDAIVEAVGALAVRMSGR
jgi:hypothetical protein